VFGRLVIYQRLTFILQMILNEFIKERDSQHLFQAIELWVDVNPPLFDHAQLLGRLDVYRDPDVWVLEAKGKLLIRAGKVLQLYCSCRLLLAFCFILSVCLFSTRTQFCAICRSNSLAPYRLPPRLPYRVWKLIYHNIHTITSLKSSRRRPCSRL
jgi:hypothetical protein